ncbi:hypothetical protein VCHC50A1_2905, partial [Vibrio cholerae HC-50A1]
MAFSAG